MWVISINSHILRKEITDGINAETIARQNLFLQVESLKMAQLQLKHISEFEDGFSKVVLYS